MTIPYVTREFIPFPSYSSERLYAFGPGVDNDNWGLGELWAGNGAARNPKLRDTLAKVEEIATVCGISNLLVPSVRNFNALVCSASDFVVSAKSPGGTLTLHSGRFVDGTIVPPGYASWQASADCWTILARNMHKKATAHAGLKSLYDLSELKSGKKSRPNFSVVDGVTGKLGGNAKDTHVFIACGIRKENYGHPIHHPQYGKDNQELFRYCKWLSPACAYQKGDEYHFDIPGIIEAQFVRQGVPPENIRTSQNKYGYLTDTYADMDNDGNFLWHSHRRDRTPKRNALLFVNAA